MAIQKLFSPAPVCGEDRYYGDVDSSQLGVDSDDLDEESLESLLDSDQALSSSENTASFSLGLTEAFLQDGSLMQLELEVTGVAIVDLLLATKIGGEPFRPFSSPGVSRIFSEKDKKGKLKFFLSEFLSQGLEAGRLVWWMGRSLFG